MQNNKWLLVSQLQKSIRRGHLDDALKSTRLLYDIDKNYFKFRLATIMVEDVICGDDSNFVDVPASWGKKEIETLGGLDYFLDLVEKMTTSIKDRTPCDWIDCRHFLSDFEKKWGSWESLNPEKAMLEFAWNRDLGWWERGLGIWRALGTEKYTKDGMPKCTGIQNWWDIAEKMLEKDLSHIKFYANSQRECHPVFIPLVLDTIKQEVIKKIKLDIQPEYVNGWLKSAIDGHTAEGKRALKILWENRPKNDPEFINITEEKAMIILKKLWFWLEGGILADYLDFNTRRKIISDSRKKFQQVQGINGSHWYNTFGNMNNWLLAQESVFKKSLYKSPKI
jgi:hypothetical protein